MKVRERIQHAWNAFTGRDTDPSKVSIFSGSTRPQYRGLATHSTSSFAGAVFNRIAIDVATTTFNHVKIDAETEDRKTMDSGLNYCLTTEANLDQSASAFIQDLVYSMFDEGVVAVVPVDTTLSPNVTGGYDVNTLRVGKIVKWYPEHVKVKLYNEKKGTDQEVYLPKKATAIIENPLYPVTNGENSVLQRLIRKIAQLDDFDQRASSGQLDLIIQLPYSMKTETQKTNAKERIKDIEDQLNSNRHGVAYIDGTEKVVQLNRPANDQLPSTIESLTQMFYDQLGLTANIVSGTASEAEVRTYYSRTIDPIIEFILEEFNRKFLTKTARTQGHTIEAYRDMFKFVSINALADMSDKFRRNSILTANEIRRIMKLKTHNDPRANELYNPNMPDDKQGRSPDDTKVKAPEKYDEPIEEIVESPGEET